MHDFAPFAYSHKARGCCHLEAFIPALTFIQIKAIHEIENAGFHETKGRTLLLKPVY